ncbi:hypothetical protein JW826_05880 [Candidatus Woesearchaeota archaeon]|nr:hypothetical protein [Candidatus Woesearchaeota archaeon]
MVDKEVGQKRLSELKDWKDKDQKDQASKDDKRADQAGKPSSEPVDKPSSQPVSPELFARSNVALRLERYEDVFSDFDPRPFSERALSDDFLAESRKVARDKRGSLELELLVPEALHQSAIDAKVRKRLKDHFIKHRDQLVLDNKAIHRKGVMITLSGFVLMVLATFLYDWESPLFVFSFIRTMIEPAGWFMVWFGLDQLFYTKAQNKADIEFYSKMASASIRFTSY